MPELTARNLSFIVLVAATVAAVLAAVVLLARQDDNAPVRIIAPTAQQESPAQVRVYVNGRWSTPESTLSIQKAGSPTPWTPPPVSPTKTSSTG